MIKDGQVRSSQRYRYREELFPTTRFRLAYDDPSAQLSVRAASKE